MAGENFIGVDIGTQGTRAALYDSAGTLLAEAVEASELLHPSPDSTEEDPERQFGSVCRTIRICLERARVAPASVAAVALDGQMAGIIGVGSDGLAVTPYDSWLDTRCAPYVAKMEAAAGIEILGKTGNVPSFNHGPKILWWKGERPSEYGRIASFVQPGGYAAMRLCGLGGRESFIDDSYLHFSGFADNAAGNWDEGLAREFGVDLAKLPRIVSPLEIVGTVSTAASAASGLRAGTPVAAGLGDTTASFLACGAVRPGICVDVAGTASVFAATVECFAPDTASRVLGCGHSAIRGLWHPYAYINGGGLNLNWFAEEVARDPLDTRASSASDPVPAADLENRLERLGELVAAAVPSLDDPFFVPHMEGRVMPNSSGMRGVWAGLKRSHNGIAMYRSLLEAVALEYAIYRDALLALRPEQKLLELRATGGGSKAPYWNQLKADLLGMPVVAVDRTGGAPMGAALIAGAAVGALPDLGASVCSWVKLGHRFEPQREFTSIYMARIARYRRLLDLASSFVEP